ncbi:Uncharacterised protein [Slackia heliotrinireducens]|uniref:Uncharacterized protein n=1 Tax=Slackia heliotrinireducens (strain ATCC 29202 / DSM 20476 / NCTC 11029 / RHS 1) TaxID=471855 RepID=C7N807_SLAHD|nr:hypothetical protein [Slackia heliotrinireducens]ACV23042.1 hypothetical protein Shel_20290 [Slackia heliotrinireducens DSM 20476]VEH01973.1 Uncharacterised protein [Slackia heliotrinireducens]
MATFAEIKNVLDRAKTIQDYATPERFMKSLKKVNPSAYEDAMSHAQLYAEDAYSNDYENVIVQLAADAEADKETRAMRAEKAKKRRAEKKNNAGSDAKNDQQSVTPKPEQNQPNVTHDANDASHDKGTTSDKEHKEQNKRAPFMGAVV